MLELGSLAALTAVHNSVCVLRVTCLLARLSCNTLRPQLSSAEPSLTTTNYHLAGVQALPTLLLGTDVTHTCCSAVAEIIVYEGRQYAKALLKEYAQAFGLALHPCLLCLFWPCAFHTAPVLWSDDHYRVCHLTTTGWSRPYIYIPVACFT